MLIYNCNRPIVLEQLCATLAKYGSQTIILHSWLGFEKRTPPFTKVHYHSCEKNELSWTI